ncbi:MAG: Baseplate wedge protein gp25 [Bacteroidota bacterium]|jgi:predicted component of type VI protein secretion system
MNYYALPLKVDRIITGKKLETVDIQTSVQQNIRLILKTMPLEYAYDAMFGSVLNKFQYATPPQKAGQLLWRNGLRESIRKNLKFLLEEYEPRLKIEDVLVNLSEPIQNAKEAIVLVKVTIKGELALGRKEIFHFPDSQIDSEAKSVFPLMIPIGNK